MINNQESDAVFHFIKMKRRIILLNLVFGKGSYGDSAGNFPASRKGKFLEIIQAYGGSIFLDEEQGLIALFGLPKTYEDLAQRVLRAAHELLVPGASVKKPGEMPPFSILLDSKLVTVSELNQGQTYQFLEQAQVIEQLTEITSKVPAGKWLISKDTLPMLRHSSPALALEPSTALEGWWEIRHFDPTHTTRHEGLVNLNLEKNLTRLNTLGELLLAGIGRTAVLIGESGVGKSSLLQAWQAHFNKQPGADAVRWVELSACPYRKNLPHRLTLELLASLVGLDFSEQDDGLPGQLLEGLTRLKACPADLDLQNLKDFLTVTYIGEQAAATLPEEHIEIKLNEMLRRILERLANENPLVIVIDNLHHADAHSAHILAELCAETSLAPILACLITRPEYQSEGWQLINRLESSLGNQVVRIALDRLSVDETETLIADILQTELDTAPVANFIYYLAEGNPLFTATLTKKLLSNGKITQSGQGWIIQGELGIEDMPEVVCTMMSAEFDRLPPEVQQIYKVACIFGKTFAELTLRDALSGQRDPASIRKDLGILEKNGLIRLIKASPYPVYQFQPALLQEVVYQALSPEDRSKWHLKIGETLEKENQDNFESVAEQLAYHFLHAQKPALAARYYQQAGQKALQQHANHEASMLLRKALALADDEIQTSQLLADLGLALDAQSKHEEAIATWKEAAQIYERLGNFDRVARLYAWMARAAWWSDTLDQNLICCLEGMKKVQDKGESADIAYLIHECGRSYYFNGQMEQAQKACETALRMAQKLKAVDVQAEILATLGILPTLAPQAAITVLEKSIALAQKHQLNSTAARAYMNLAAVVENLGQIRRSHEYRHNALDFGVRSNGSIDELFAKTTLIHSEILLGNFDEAILQITEIKALAQRETEQPEYLSTLPLMEAEIERQKGNFQTAIALLLDYIKTKRQLGLDEEVLIGNYRLSDVLMAQVLIGDPSASQNNIDMAVAMMDDALANPNMTAAEAEILDLLSLGLAYKKDYPKAEDLWQKAQQVAGQLPGLFQKTQVMLTSARLAKAKGDFEAAILGFEHCAERFSDMETRWWLAHTRLELAQALIQKGEAESLDQAQTQLREALQDFHAMDCVYYENQVEANLRWANTLAREQAVRSRLNTRELNEAGKVQSSFIPASVPKLEGWEIAAVLDPARETSGDFYDFITLPIGKIGIAIADVGDKGAGAALYMTMSRTIIRTYAIQESSPARVLNLVNQRILSDTQQGIFLTLVYGVLDPQQNRFTYVNAGHNPPIFIQANNQPQSVHQLTRTGTLVGLFENETWQEAELAFEKGDTLVIYTDGITEAESKDGAFFGMQRLLQVINANPGQSAKQLLQIILAEINAFTGGSELLDDISVVIIKRKP